MAAGISLVWAEEVTYTPGGGYTGLAFTSIESATDDVICLGHLAVWNMASANQPKMLQNVDN